MSHASPADLPIPLPSTLRWEWCVSHGVQSLTSKEAQLWLAQANESIHKICLSLGFKSAIYHTQVRLAKSQKRKTHAWSAIHSVETTVHEHAQIYSMARAACCIPEGALCIFRWSGAATASPRGSPCGYPCTWIRVDWSAKHAAVLGVKL